MSINKAYKLLYGASSTKNLSEKEKIKAILKYCFKSDLSEYFTPEQVSKIKDLRLKKFRANIDKLLYSEPLV